MFNLPQKCLAAFLMALIVAHGPIAAGAYYFAVAESEAAAREAEKDSDAASEGDSAEDSTAGHGAPPAEPHYLHTCGMHPADAPAESCAHCATHCTPVAPEPAESASVASGPLTAVLVSLPCNGPLGADRSSPLTPGLMRYVMPSGAAVPAPRFANPSEFHFEADPTRFFSEPLSPPPQARRA